MKIVGRRPDHAYLVVLDDEEQHARVVNVDTGDVGQVMHPGSIAARGYWTAITPTAAEVERVKAVMAGAP